MLSPDSFQYALENTRVLLRPRRTIQTFGTTRFRFQLLTESMDRADEVRLREGTVEAERPQILTPERSARLLLEGFGERAAEFADALARRARESGTPLPTALRYGFQIRRGTVEETVFAHTDLDAVAERLLAGAGGDNDGLQAVLAGVEDGWEVSLLKLAIDLVGESTPGNLGDFRGRGLL